MSCLLNPAFFVYLIVLIGAVAIMRIVFPWFISFFGLPDPIGRILMIILWVVIACLGVYFLFGLLGCLFSGGGLGGALTFPHSR
jgi:hypothetical protein